MRKRIRMSILLLMVMVVGFQALIVQAHEVPDMSRQGSICITMLDGETRVPGGKVTVYRVGQIQDVDGDYIFILTDEYAGSQVSLEDLQSKAAAKALADYAAESDLQGEEESIDKNGDVSFPDLELGLYLIVQTKAADGYYPADPFLVSVPMYDGTRYLYDVVATPKVELTEAPEETTEATEATEPEETTKPTETTPPTEPEEPKLPQTGQTNWPIPILAVAGLVLIAFGWFLCAGQRKDEHAR